MDLELTGRVAVVTGASKGIGLAVTRLLGGRGSRRRGGAQHRHAHRPGRRRRLGGRPGTSRRSGAARHRGGRAPRADRRSRQQRRRGAAAPRRVPEGGRGRPVSSIPAGGLVSSGRTSRSSRAAAPSTCRASRGSGTSAARGEHHRGWSGGRCWRRSSCSTTTPHPARFDGTPGCGRTLVARRVGDPPRHPPGAAARAAARNAPAPLSEPAGGVCPLCARLGESS
jgi:hypothetical protein